MSRRFLCDLGNAYAQYALAKLYLAGEDTAKNIPKAIRLFTLSAEKKNEFAAYQLGKLYLKGEDVPKDTEAAIRWLTASAELSNQYAQYALGKLYFYYGDIPRDKEKRLYWLGLAAAQGNVYAQFLIENINNPHNPSVLLATTRLLHRLENLFREDYRRSAGTDHIDRRHTPICAGCLPISSSSGLSAGRCCPNSPEKSCSLRMGSTTTLCLWVCMKTVCLPCS